MGVTASFLIAVGLAMDAFAVSLGIGCTGQARSPRPVFRISFHMGLFQGLMAFLGWLTGTSVVHLIAGVDHWIAMLLLAFVGIRMIRSGISEAEEKPAEDPSRGGRLILICIATSIDAMAVGLSLAMLEAEILGPSLIIGLVTLGLSLFGLLTGRFLGNRFGKRMEILGGLILIGIGLQILTTHLCSLSIEQSQRNCYLCSSVRAAQPAARKYFLSIQKAR
jgi:putative Mn2+ efflux pump MntP